ncbi:MAG: hypothetical protein JRN66_04215 [Nitrososphaerota archaeon]|jgi:hypothetical protein|nr:hypothetical protein [Nitrososphaerota archaeon]
MSKEIIRILNNIDILYARLDRDGDANTITANIKTHTCARRGAGAGDREQTRHDKYD